MLLQNQTLPLGALLLGVVLLITSFLTGGLGKSSSAWTAEDEAAYSAATEKWRALGHSHGPQDTVAEAEANRITEQFEQQRQKFHSASNRGRTLSSLCWWGGLLMLAAGSGIVFVQRMMGDEA